MDERPQSPSSIPSKWTRRPFTPHEEPKKGFGLSTYRFNSNINNIPGPGYYNLDDGEQRLNSPSHSAMGYGGGFVSNSPQQPPLDSEKVKLPGPGYYEIPVSSDAYQTPRSPQTTFTSQFAPPIFHYDARKPYEKKEKTPGPLYYRVNHPNKPKLLDKKKHASFVSVTNRKSLVSSSCDPGVGRYNLPPSPGGQTRSDAKWSKRSAKRNLDNVSIAPGPSHYFDPDKDAERDSRPSSRSVGSYRGPYRSKHTEKPKARAYFGGEKDRFGSIYKKSVTVPGPCAYRLADWVDDLHIDATRGSLSSPFKDNSPVRVNYLKMRESTPGPAYYSPKLQYPKITPQNFNERWMM